MAKKKATKKTPAATRAGASKKSAPTKKASAPKKKTPAGKTVGKKKKPAPKPKAAPRKPAKRPVKPAKAAKPAPRTVTKTVVKEVVREVPAPAPVNGIGLTGHHIDYSTQNLDAVRSFYTEVLGFRQFMLDETMGYLFVQTAAGASLGFMPAGEGSHPAKEPINYFMVEDVDRARTDLEKKGLVFQGDTVDQPWGHRTATAFDPDGRMLIFAAPVKK